MKEIQADESEVRQAADKQLAQARELVASIEERSIQADLKLAQVQVVRADANRKLQESEHRLQEVEAREVALRLERHSLIAEYVTGLRFSSLIVLCISATVPEDLIATFKGSVTIRNCVACHCV